MTKKSAYIKVMKVLAVIAAVTYNSWLLTYFLNPFLDSKLAFVSEYASPSQNYSMLFRVLDFIVGTLVLIIMVLFAMMKFKEKYKSKSIFELKDVTVPERKFLAKKRLGGVLLISGFTVFSVFTILDVIFPMQCPISATRLRVLNSEKCDTLANVVHEFSSALVGVAIVVLMLVVLVFWENIFTDFYTGQLCEFWCKTKNIVFVLMVIHIFSLVYTLVGVEYPDLVWLGIGQRISILSFSVWGILVFFSILELNDK